MTDHNERPESWAKAARDPFAELCARVKRLETQQQLPELATTEHPHWSEGVCGDGAAILRDGVMVPIEQVIARLNQAEAADDRIDALQKEVEITRNKLGACGAVAMIHSPKSIVAACDVRPEFWSTSLDNVAFVVDQLMEARAKLQTLEQGLQQPIPRFNLRFRGVDLVPPIDCPDPMLWIAERVYEQATASVICQHVVTTDEGTSYCGLAEQQAQQQQPEPVSLAAAIRAAADEVVPDEGHALPIHHSSVEWFRFDERKKVRAGLLAIAARREAQQQPSMTSPNELPSLLLGLSCDLAEFLRSTHLGASCIPAAREFLNNVADFLGDMDHTFAADLLRLEAER